jgi:hypothetical protein
MIGKLRNVDIDTTTRALDLGQEAQPLFGHGSR